MNAESALQSTLRRQQEFFLYAAVAPNNGANPQTETVCNFAAAAAKLFLLFAAAMSRINRLTI
jgi:hypothetical protein